MKQVNKKLVLILLEKEGRTTGDELSEKMHMSVSTIKRIIQDINNQIPGLISSKSGKRRIFHKNLELTI